MTFLSETAAGGALFERSEFAPLRLNLEMSIVNIRARAFLPTFLSAQKSRCPPQRRVRFLINILRKMLYPHNWIASELL